MILDYKNGDIYVDGHFIMEISGAQGGLFYKSPYGYGIYYNTAVFAHIKRFINNDKQFTKITESFLEMLRDKYSECITITDVNVKCLDLDKIKSRIIRIRDNCNIETIRARNDVYEISIIKNIGLKHLDITAAIGRFILNNNSIESIDLKVKFYLNVKYNKIHTVKTTAGVIDITGNPIKYIHAPKKSKIIKD